MALGGTGSDILKAFSGFSDPGSFTETPVVSSKQCGGRGSAKIFGQLSKKGEGV